MAGALRSLQRMSSGSRLGTPAVGEHMGPYGHIGETPATEGGLVAAILAFWIYVGTASRQGQGGRRPEWNLSIQVALDMEVGSWQTAQF